MVPSVAKQAAEKGLIWGVVAVSAFAAAKAQH